MHQQQGDSNSSPAKLCARMHRSLGINSALKNDSHWRARTSLLHAALRLQEEEEEEAKDLFAFNDAIEIQAEMQHISARTPSGALTQTEAAS